MKQTKRKCIVFCVAVAMLQMASSHAGGTPGQKSERASTNQLQLPDTVSADELEFLGSHSHRSHAAGPATSQATHFGTPAKHAAAERRRVSNRYRYAKFMDQAWTVMLYKQGIIDRDVAVKVLTALAPSATGGEGKLKSLLGGDEDTAAVPQLGRTLQEPMARMQLRDKQLDVIDATHEFLEVLLDAIERHADTIMPGMTHMAHAQPTTYGAYLLSVHDGVYRGLEHLELAYRHTNENSGGCGATSGTGWPVDRYLVTELLGFDKLVEPTYDGEAGQDYAMNTLFALSNLMITLSRTAMDHGIWGMDGYRTHTLPAAHLGVSSLMPQKAHSGSAYERIRISVNNVIGATTIGMLGLKGEPHADVLPSYQAAYRAPNAGAIGALCETEMTLVIFSDMIKTMNVDREKLLQLTRDGWGCTPDLVVKLVGDKGYGGRRAHRICAVMVRLAREHRGLKPYELTGTMLDEAARVAKEEEPGLTTEEVRDMMDPVQFIERHRNTGDPHPKETARMVESRRRQLADSRAQQATRRGKIQEAMERLDREVAAICTP